MKKLLLILLFFACKAQGQIVITSPISTQISGASISIDVPSHTYDANQLYIAFVFSRDGDAAELPTSVIGTAVSFTQIATVIYNTTVTGFSRLTVYRYMGTVNQTETVTITWPETQTVCGFSVKKATGIDLSGTNGSGAIVQSATINSDATSDPSITMSALTGGRNSVLAGFSNDNTSFGGTPESGWTALDEGAFSNLTIYSQYRHLTTDNTPTVTAASSDWAGIAIEIKSVARRRIIIDYFWLLFSTSFFGFKRKKKQYL